MSRPHLWLVLVVATVAISACGDASTPTTTAPPATTTPPATTMPPPTSVVTAPPTSVAVTSSTTSTSTTSTTTTTSPPPTTLPDGEVEIDVDFYEGQSDAEDRIAVKIGDRVTLTVRADVADEVHVHGYDVFGDVTPDAPAVIRFTADIPGIFEVELESSRVALFELVVEP